MINSKKLLTGGMDGDSAPQMIAEDAYLNITNGRVAMASEYGRGFRCENIPGNTLVSQSVYPPYGTSFPIGSGIDYERGWLIYFLCNTFEDHGIYAYSASTGTTYAVIYDSQITGGLGLSKDYRIDRNVRIVGDMVYWTDNNNDPRRLNFIAGIKANQAGYDTEVLPYQFPMEQQVFTIIRRPPYYAVSVTKATDAGYENNFIKNEATQFAVRYRYRDYEYSVIGEWSELVPYNAIAETSNYVEVAMPAAELIDQDVIEAELFVKFGNRAIVAFRIHTWDADDILAHNSGAVPLTFNFYNDISGDAIDQATLYKPFDSVPHRSKTIEQAKNRVFLGNNVEGYDTPVSTSMAIGVATVSDDGSYDAVWGLLTIYYYSGGSVVNSTGYYAMYVPTLGRYFMIDPIEGIDPPDTPVSALDSDIDSTLLDSLAGYITGIYPPAEDYDYFECIFETDPSGDPLLPATLTLTDVDLPTGATQRAFKSEGSYGGAMVFFDKFRRKCGAVTNATLRVEMPVRTYDTAVFNAGMTWEVSNTNAVDEIPDWAYYYAPLRTENLQTRFFASARAVQMFYVSKDADGVYDYSHTTYDADRYAVAVDVSTLPNIGMGYTFAEGDIMKLFFDTTPADQDVSILGQDGKWVLIQANDFGVLGALVKPLFEIYTPYKPSVSEPYWEVGQIYPVLNPTAANRQYSTTGGLFNGDVYIIERGNTGSTYLTENMSPNDKLWQNWYTDRGWDNYIDKIGQVHKTNSISWSNTYIQGTKTNGLSSWDALDEKAIPLECGIIQKLQLTAKVSNEGNVMLSICSYQTVSMYLSEVQLLAAQGDAFVAQSIAVIGTINVLKGNYGTVDPSSVIEHKGLVFWVDASNGSVVQYSINGLDAISDNKMKRFFQRYLLAYKAASTGNLDNINGFHHIGTCVDPFTEELLITLPALIYENYANQLPSYSSVPSYASDVINRFDIYDELGKTMAFDIKGNAWRQNYEYMPEWMDYFDNKLFGFKNANLYRFNSDTTNWNTFFGVQYPMRVCLSWNLKDAPSAIKDVFNIALESNVAPDFTVLYATYPWIQITDLIAGDYDGPEGVFYAEFFRDRLSANATGTPEQKMYSGDVVKDNCPKVMIEFHQYEALAYVTFVNLGFEISKGTDSLIGK